MDYLGKRLLHTPEGVRDIYGEEYAKKLTVHELFHEKLNAFGYQDIQTPTFEFFDVFGSKIGTTPSKDLYKFFDKEGNTLVLRPDFTPSIARCAAKYFMEETMPLRFCYFGNTFTNTSNLQGKLKETTQMGAELIGDPSADADAEMIAMLINALKNTGLEEFQVSIGQIEYFKGLCEELKLDEDTEIALRELISNKNYFGAEELLSDKQIEQSDIDVLLKINDMFGTIEIVEDAKALVRNKRSLEALKRLEEIYKRLLDYGVERYVSFDLGMVSKYNYYTGMILKAYTYGIGDAIAKGGRYDNLLAEFGKDAPATGFMVVIDDLVAALTRQKIALSVENNHVLLLYSSENVSTAIIKAEEYRAEGYLIAMMKKNAEKQFDDYVAYAKSNHYQAVYELLDDASIRIKTLD